MTTGAADDIERCTEIARQMVTQYGMSDLLGPQALGQARGEVFLGKDQGRDGTYSQSLAGTVDSEVRRLVDAAHQRARAILEAHRGVLGALTAELVEHETLDDDDLRAIFGGLDKGTGIDLPRRERPAGLPSADRDLAPRPARDLVGVAAGAVGLGAPQRSGPPGRRWGLRQLVRALRAPRPT
jgi:cell division protease FtsH